MKNIIIGFLSIFTLLMIAEACTSIDDKAKANVEIKRQDSLKAIAKKDSIEACTKTIMDPNNPKPMALLMRVQAANADSMHQQLLRGEKLDSNQYPFIHFYLVEPTDPKVLEPQFFENARTFKRAYEEVFTHPTAQKKFYNIMINGCIKCHEKYCSGPLKRIRKFPIGTSPL
ncbi:MAG: hypothetical protein Q8M15_09480 [Bacteroidota bacterium]|nr:hypothetical protein [Bacteroidota bacterium]